MSRTKSGSSGEAVACLGAASSPRASLDRALTAEYAFCDALLALEERGLQGDAARLRERWRDVPDPTAAL